MFTRLFSILEIPQYPPLNGVKPTRSSDNLVCNALHQASETFFLNEISF
jgi:hypothetical protein